MAEGRAAEGSPPCSSINLEMRCLDGPTVAQMNSKASSSSAGDADSGAGMAYPVLGKEGGPPKRKGSIGGPGDWKTRSIRFYHFIIYKNPEVRNAPDSGLRGRPGRATRREVPGRRISLRAAIAGTRMRGGY